MLSFLELISIELPDEYEKESWQLSENEKFNTVKECREIGNELYRKGKIDEAEEKYRSALAIIEPLLLKYLLNGHDERERNMLISLYFVLLQRKATWYWMVGLDKDKNSIAAKLRAM